MSTDALARVGCGDGAQAERPVRREDRGKSIDIWLYPIRSGWRVEGADGRIEGFASEPAAFDFAMALYHRYAEDDARVALILSNRAPPDPSCAASVEPPCAG